MVAGSSPVVLAERKRRKGNTLRRSHFRAIFPPHRIWGHFGDTARVALTSHWGALGFSGKTLGLISPDFLRVQQTPPPPSSRLGCRLCGLGRTVSLAGRRRKLTEIAIRSPAVNHVAAFKCPRHRASFPKRCMNADNVGGPVGKPFQSELAQLPQTYLWASEFSVESLAKAVRRSKAPLLAVGSGGSFTTACLAAALHERHFGLPCVPMTPLEVVRSEIDLRETAVLLLTAGGKNADILGAFHSAVRREPRRLVIVCATTGSKLAAAAAEHSTVEVCEFDPPPGRDGFLATNSLLASGLLLIRAMLSRQVFRRNSPPISKPLPVLTSARWISPPSGTGDDRRATPAVPQDRRGRDRVEVHGGGALGHVQIADYRQFAHGRHHWLAKRGDESAVLALSTDADDAIAARSCGCSPTPSPSCDLPCHTPGRCLASPGLRMPLNSSGRRASAWRSIPVTLASRSLAESCTTWASSRGCNLLAGIATPEVAIARKSRLPGRQPSASVWQDAYAGFLARLSSARILVACVGL